MAYVNTTRTGALGLSARLAQVVASVKLTVQRRRVYAQTVRELTSLTDRELADLGLARGMIGEVAREAAYGI